jgi:excinuclease ABC subunit A
MKAADMIIDIGPKAGSFGGELVAQGTFDEILKSTSLTAKYLMEI